MGKSRPTVRNMIERRRDDMEPYKKPLRRKHQDSYERLWEHAALDAPSMKMTDDGDIGWLILFGMLRGMQREIEVLEERVGELE